MRGQARVDNVGPYRGKAVRVKKETVGICSHLFVGLAAYWAVTTFVYWLISMLSCSGKVGSRNGK